MKVVIDRYRLDTGEPAVVCVTDEGMFIKRVDELVARDKYGNEVVRVTGVAKGHEPVGSARVWLELADELFVETT